MTKKHFEAIAAAIKTERDEWEAIGEAARDDRTSFARADAAVFAIDELTGRLADTLTQFQPEFDRARFLRAAGVTSEEKRS